MLCINSSFHCRFSQCQTKASFVMIAYCCFTLIRVQQLSIFASLGLMFSPDFPSQLVDQEYPFYQAFPSQLVDQEYGCIASPSHSLKRNIFLQTDEIAQVEEPLEGIMDKGSQGTKFWPNQETVGTVFAYPVKKLTGTSFGLWQVASGSLDFSAFYFV